MSELLRACLDANCVDKNTAFYTLPNVYTTVATGALTYAPSSVRLRCKADCWFMAMGWALVDTVAAAGFLLNSSESADFRFQIANLTTGEVFTFDGPTPRSSVNFNSNNFVSMPQYALFGPNHLVEAQEMIRATEIASGGTHFTSVILVGIEYRMRS